MARKLDVVTLKKACEMLDCTRVTFYKNYEKQLTKIDKHGRNRLFILTEIENLVEEKNSVHKKYNIIG